MSHPRVHPDPLAIAAGYATALLAPMLKGVEAQRSKFGCLRMTVNAEYAAEMLGAFIHGCSGQMSDGETG